MARRDDQERVAQALERVEEAILPRLSLMLDSLLDAASLARPGFDAETYANEIRTLATELDSIAGQIEAVSPARRATPESYRAASAA